MESAFIGRSSCPACGYPVKYRWMGHGNDDLMVNPDGTPHKDSCPAATFREMRKRAMKAPRPQRQYNGPQLCAPQLTQPSPGETPSSILERLLQTPLPKRTRAKASEAEDSQTITDTEATATEEVVEEQPLPVAAPTPRPPKHPRRAKVREKLESPEQPKRPRGRPRRDPMVVVRPEKPEKPSKPEREVARCPACAIPLITDLNTGAQVCLTCDFQLAPPQAASGN